ncbi:MAG: SDR family NAD(P)-dependent oxidoreductase [Rhodobacteraceae bacterium]|nr:SDR family NAD(P)-dependent oxidoreductase [Paracoccaceae bacterium]
MSLEGRHALVTGGGTGIGLAIAQALAGAGAQVTITGRRDNVLEQAGDIHGLNPVMMDVTVEASISNAIQQATRKLGPITICVANAGVAEGRALHKTELSFWRRIMATNLDGAFLTIRDCLHGMRAEGWGRVIAVSSVAGLRGLKGAPAYTASKHGVIGLIRAMSEDYLGTGITFNALCPGYTDTDIVLRNSESIAERAGISPDEARDLMISANRHGRLIDPAEVAAAALWLCEPGAESVNGQAIEIAGGQA